MVTLFARRKRIDWAAPIQCLVEEEYPKVDKNILVVDNLNIYTRAALYEALPAERARKIIEKLEVHYTPEHGRWVNITEIELSHLGRPCLNRQIGDAEILAKKVKAWCEECNKRASVADWQFTKQDARIKLKKFYLTTNNCD